MKKILIVKIGAIGDVVMSLPIVSLLNQLYSGLHITWICGKAAASLVDATKRVDRLIIVDEKKLLAGSFGEKCKALLHVWKEVGKERFDQAFLLHADFRYRALWIPIFCKDKRHWGKNGRRFFPVPGRTHTHETLRLVLSEKGPQSFDPLFPPLDLPKNPFDQKFQDKPLIVLAPGGAKNVLADDALRRWPIDHYVELIRKFSCYPCHIAMIGSESDHWIVPHLGNLPVHCLIGKMNLLESISFLKGAALFVTHDSGPLHLAKLAQCPTIGLFGPTNPCEKVAPQENIEVLWGGKHLSCRPCYAGKSYAPCTENRCLKDLQPLEVFETARKMLRWERRQTLNSLEHLCQN